MKVSLPWQRQMNVYFKEVSVDTQKEILRLENKKASRNIDIPTEIIKKNTDIFADYLCSSINGSIKSSTFPSSSKVAHVIPVYKKGKNMNKKL